MSIKFFASVLLAISAGAGHAQDYTISVYTGLQSSPHSNVAFDNGMGTSLDFVAGWEGRSLEMPPYYGLRGTVWMYDHWGVGGEFTHAKVYSDDETRADNGFTTLEFTDGINIVTANLLYRWSPSDMKLTPYAGGGVGVSVPHVEVEGNGSSELGYQVTGPAIRLVGGVSLEVTDRMDVFAEYNGTYSMNTIELNDGGTMSTNIVTNAINVGVSYNF